MSYTHLKSRKHYEDLYDEGTVDQCRSGERVVNKTFAVMDKKLPASEKKQRQAGWYLMYSQLYFNYVETVAAARHHNREKRIAEWMEADEKKDLNLADAHIASKMYCRSCGKDMHVISKDYLRRDGREEDDILLMFECDACNKRKAFWRDGTEWEGARINCDKCGGDMKSIHKTKGKVIISTMTCAKCGHIETDVMDLSKDLTEEEQVDHRYELDRKRFVFDKDMEDKYMNKLQHFMRMAKLELENSEHIERVDIYEAIKDIKQLKIAQLSDLLRDSLEKDGYREFKLGNPELGQQVAISFSCLDDKSERKEHDSKKGLQKLINKALEETNWRLMSDGVDYRLGYLNGRLRAYEKEEDLKNLLEQRIKKVRLNYQKKKYHLKPLKKTSQNLNMKVCV